VIEFNEVDFSYGVGDTLSGLTLTLEAGSFHFLTGESGAGKSTFLQLLYLALRPTRGRLKLFGGDVAQMTRADVAATRRRIGVVFQDFRLLDHLTVAENVALPLRVAGQRPADYAGDVEELAAWVGLSDRMGARPPELSGGEKQRAGIARAVVASPELIIADEPTGNVDPKMALRIMSLFGELNRLGKTIVVATHDLNLIDQLSGRLSAGVLRLHEGRLLQVEQAA
jgi:cell division transport system ATP-binding protein